MLSKDWNNFFLPTKNKCIKVLCAGGCQGMGSGCFWVAISWMDPLNLSVTLNMPLDVICWGLSSKLSTKHHNKLIFIKNYFKSPKNRTISKKKYRQHPILLINLTKYYRIKYLIFTSIKFRHYFPHFFNSFIPLAYPTKHSLFYFFINSFFFSSD